MIRSLYTSGWSMMANGKKLDVISNNLANSNTNGFKKDTVVFESFPSVLARRINDTKLSSNPSGEIGKMELGSDVGEIFTYYNQSPVAKTGNNFDMAFQNSNTSFFTIAVPDANGNIKEYYTRDGSFTINADRQLVTKEGYAVMGENGPITLSDEDFTVREDGTIIQNGQEVDKFLIKDFVDTRELKKFGSSLVEAGEGAEEQPFTGAVVQGYIEQSNVDVVKEMVDMISVMRAYEANQKMLQAQDGTLEKAVNEVGSVR
ncbi:MAG: flagellar hook-basal body protein [Clostridia bacterium]|nr:flagellar hook-basal body protein [Clostridia bacterium]